MRADTLISCGEDNMTQVYLTNGEYISSDNSHNGFVTSPAIIEDNVYSASYDGYKKASSAKDKVCGCISLK